VLVTKVNWAQVSSVQVRSVPVNWMPMNSVQVTPQPAAPMVQALARVSALALVRVQVLAQVLDRVQALVRVPVLVRAQALALAQVPQPLQYHPNSHPASHKWSQCCRENQTHRLCDKATPPLLTWKMLSEARLTRASSLLVQGQQWFPESRCDHRDSKRLIRQQKLRSVTLSCTTTIRSKL
jgi:hypothetical protein